MRPSESVGAILQPRSQELLEAGSAAVPPRPPRIHPRWSVGQCLVLWQTCLELGWVIWAWGSTVSSIAGHGRAVTLRFVASKTSTAGLLLQGRIRRFQRGTWRL